MTSNSSNDDNKNCQDANVLIRNHHENPLETHTHYRCPTSPSTSTYRRPTSLPISTNRRNPLSSIPGAFHVSGPGIQDATNSTESDAYNDLPCTVVMDTDIEVEDIIDGVLVPTNVRKNSQSKIIYFFLGTLVVSFFTAITVFLFVGPQLSSNSGHASIQPSLSPTTTIDYEAYLRSIIVNISGEDVLRNTSSIQYLVFRKMAQRLPVYESQSILFLNDTEGLIQRYVMGVVGMTLSLGIHKRFDFKNIPDYHKACDVPVVVCNDEEKIVKLFLQNEWATMFGGGIIATELGELKSLTHLILTRSALQGTIPSEIGKLTNLQYLDMNSNKLTGKIPTEIGKLHNMNMMFLQANNLTNSIPSEIGNNLSRLVYMDLSLNMLNGTVPTELNMLNELKGLKMHGNLFTGSVNFVCQKNMTNSSLEFELDYGLGGVVLKTLDLGISVDCMNGLRMPECACCVC